MANGWDTHAWPNVTRAQVAGRRAGGPLGSGTGLEGLTERLVLAGGMLQHEPLPEVLGGRGRLAIWDVIAGPVQPIHFPVPWADAPEISFLAQGDELRQIARDAGFEATSWNDLTAQTVESLRAQMSGPARAAGLQTYVPNFPAKAANLLLNLEEQRVRTLRALLECT
jgi:hypothetical protein